MTGEQILVLVLLTVAFGVGWIARGDGRRRRSPAERASPGTDTTALRELLAAADAALDRAIVACAAARALAGTGEAGDPTRAVTLEVLSRAVAELEPVRERLRAEFGARAGADHPLVGDLEEGASAVGLVAAWLEEGAEPDGTEAARALERAARDALTRYRRLAQALTPLL